MADMEANADEPYSTDDGMRTDRQIRSDAETYDSGISRNSTIGEFETHRLLKLVIELLIDIRKVERTR